ncbi:MAG: hypothetical protein ABIZ80_18190 [Bryobacteraceae bacterium]
MDLSLQITLVAGRVMAPQSAGLAHLQAMEQCALKPAEAGLPAEFRKDSKTFRSEVMRKASVA